MVQKSKKPPMTRIDDPWHPSAAAVRAPISLKSRSPRRSICSARTDFAATSLDDLSAATGINRPSLYGAFGDKRELYIKSYRRYREDARAAMQDIFREEQPIRQRLQRIYAVALDIYLSGESDARLFHGDDGGVRSGSRSRYPRHGAGRA